MVVIVVVAGSVVVAGAYDGKLRWLEVVFSGGR